jgi:Flp pilus assembly secretin CpaC
MRHFMRHFSRPSVLWASRCFVGTLLFVNVAGAANAQKAANETILVTLDRATILQLPQNAVTIIIGNPSVADVTMIKKSNQMVLTGKGFGQTNLIALDSTGRSVGESNIRVVENKTNIVVQRGMERESWDCSPRCNPTVSLGDAPRFMTETIGQAQARTSSMGVAK